jgi:diketogulonate reductase-like aldo/keto reductase
VIKALRRGLDLGMTHLDTAEMYGSGPAEEIVGQAIAGRRNDVFLVSKVLPQNASRRGTKKACEASLARLQTDHLDCYLLHWRGSHPLAETVAGFRDLKAAGRILAWGVSNFDVPDLEELRKIVDQGELACNQVLYHLRKRAIEQAVLPWCEKHGVAVVAYSPFGQGSFPKARSSGGGLLRQIGERHQASPRQIALAFLLRYPSVFAIPKAANVQHVEENAGAANISLTSDEISQIDRAFPLGPDRSSLPML